MGYPKQWTTKNQPEYESIPPFTYLRAASNFVLARLIHFFASGNFSMITSLFDRPEQFLVLNRAVIQLDHRLFRRQADRDGKPEQVFQGSRLSHVSSVHPNGRQLLTTERPSEEHSPGTHSDIAVIDLEGEPRRTAWLETSFSEYAPAVSPDGLWVAFVSRETGKGQVNVRPFESSGGSQQVSRDSGRSPFWSRDGKTLFFTSGHALMASNIRHGTTEPAATTDSAGPTRLDFETPEKLFDLPPGVRDLSSFPAGERFLALIPATAEQNDPAIIHVMLEAHERLKRIAPVPRD